MSKQVRETVAGRAIQVWLIMKNGKEIAYVHAHIGKGAAIVDIFEHGRLTYQGRATGYGYDKLTAAMAGAVIDGNKIFNHCGQDDRVKKLEKQMLQITYGDYKMELLKKKAEKIGASFCNFMQDKNTYISCYYDSGLERLKALGYNVIKVF